MTDKSLNELIRDQVAALVNSPAFKDLFSRVAEQAVSIGAFQEQELRATRISPGRKARKPLIINRGRSIPDPKDAEGWGRIH